MNRVFSQFGWQFEYKIVPQGGGPAFIVELIPLLGAVEYSRIIPSVNIPIGVRFTNGFEFGLAARSYLWNAPSDQLGVGHGARENIPL